MTEIIGIKHEHCMREIIRLRRQKTHTKHRNRKLSALRDIWHNSFDYLISPDTVWPYDYIENIDEILHLK